MEQEPFTDNKDLLSIDRAVNHRIVIGKFSGLPTPTTIHGDILIPANIPGTQDDWIIVADGQIHRAPDIIPKSVDQSGRIEYMTQRHFFLPFFPEQSNNIRRSGIDLELARQVQKSLNVIYSIDEQNPIDMNIAFMNPCSNQDLLHRNWGVFTTMVSLPIEKGQELIRLITQKPKKAQEFLDLAFEGSSKIISSNQVQQVTITDANEYLLKTQLLNFRSRDIFAISRDQFSKGAVVTKQL
jgi:hypothetical protein